MQINKDEIRKALEASTPGPWEAIEIGMPSGAVWRVDIANRFSRNIATAMSKDNAILTANAPDWLRALLASDDAKDETIQQQAEELQRMKQRLLMPVGVYEGYEQLQAENAQQAAEIERLLESIRHRSEAYDQLNQRLQAAEQERDELQGLLTRESDRLTVERKTSALMQRENAALRECLAWYADESQYTIPHVGCSAKVNADRGKRARTLLAELDRKDTQPKEDEMRG